MYRCLVPSLLLLALAAPAAAQAPARPAAPAAAPTQRVPDTMEARTLACVGCHGEQGRGVENVYYPRLAGKPAGYLYNQLIAFQQGRRKYAPMNYLLAYLPPPYLMKMAEYFAAQNPPPIAVPRSQAAPALLKAGERIVRQGIPGKQIPACVACHGADLAGREPGIPGLLGLRADYISAQLGAWRYGTRTALGPDCMQVIASTMTETDVAAVSAWLATLEVARTPPARRDATPLPMACGSQQAHGG